MDPQQGIMALPESDQAPAPQLSLDESYDAVRQGLQNASPQASQMLDQAMQQFKPMLAQLDDKALDAVLQVVQYLKQNEAQYPQLLAELIAKGALQPGVFPEQYDPEFLATLMMVLTAEKKDRQQTPEQPEMAPPPGMARGGIAEAARAVMSHGRGGDTMLAHINPQEARMLEAHGGMATFNPATGLREYGFFDDPLKTISDSFNDLGKSASNALNDLGNSVKDFTKTPIGRIATTVALAYVLGPAVGSAAALGLASAGTSLMAGGDLKDAVISGATAYFAAPGGMVSSMVGTAGITNMALNAAITGGLVGTTGGLLQGKNLEDSVKSGLTQGAISGLATGFSEGFTKQGTYGGVKLDQAGAAPAGTDPSGSSAGTTQTGVKTYADQSAAFDAVKNGELRVGESAQINGQGYIYRRAGMGNNYFDRAPALDAGAVAPASASASAPAATGAKATYSTGQEGQVLADIKSGRLGAGDEIIFDSGRVKIGVPNGGGGMGTGTPTFTPVTSSSAAVSTAPPPYTGGKGPDIYKMTTGTSVGGASITPTNTNGVGGFSAAGINDNAVATAGIPKIESVGAPATINGPPGYGEAFKNMYAGAKGMLPGTEGSFSEGAGKFATGAEQLFSPSLSKAELMKTPEYASAIANKQSMGAALEEAAKANAPGMIRSYGPGVAAALGTTYALGGFDPKEAPKSQQQTAMNARLAAEKARVEANPGNYVPRGMQRFGLTYNDQGELTGSGSWNPYSGLGPSRVSSNQYVAYQPSQFGIASLAAGGYPRRTGQIAGPGTATSDSIPAMLSDGEFVMTAKAVRGAGKGSKLAGAKKMYSLMHQLERNASRK